MGIEGVGSPETLREIIESGAKSLKIGHLSLLMVRVAKPLTHSHSLGRLARHDRKKSCIPRVALPNARQMQGKVDNGEWRWIDERRCVMHTATSKPALLRTEVRSRLGL